VKHPIEPLVLTLECFRDGEPVLIVRELKPPFNDTLVKSFVRDVAEQWFKAWERGKVKP